MSKKPTAADAQLILQLYDLRREAEMRKARNWWLVNFWPESAEDFMKIGGAMGTQENNWLRQAAGYWSMASSLALAGNEPIRSRRRAHAGRIRSRARCRSQ